MDGWRAVEGEQAWAYYRDGIHYLQVYANDALPHTAGAVTYSFRLYGHALSAPAMHVSYPTLEQAQQAALQALADAET